MAVALDDYINQSSFQLPSIIEMFSVVEDARRALGFNPPDNNEVIMNQAEYVTQQYRKFVSGIKDSVLDMASQGEAEELFNMLVEQKATLDAYPRDEKIALYYTVRDVWLTQLIQYVQYWILTDGQVENPEGGLNG